MILNEVFRRVDPDGRTMAEYYEQEIKHQFDVEDLFLRMDDE